MEIARQFEAVELMTAAKRLLASHADSFLKATASNYLLGNRLRSSKVSDF